MWLVSFIDNKLTRRHSSRVRTPIWKPYLFHFQWPLTDATLRWSRNEQVLTGLQWWPPDVSSRGSQVWCPGGGGSQVWCRGWGDHTWPVHWVPYHVTYPMMHLMLPTPLWTDRQMLLTISVNRPLFVLHDLFSNSCLKRMARSDKNAFQWDAYRPLIDRILACNVQGVYPSMHRARGCLPGGCLPREICLGGVCPGGVCQEGGCLPMEGVCPGGCLPREGGVCLAGVVWQTCPWTRGRHPPSRREQNHRQV